jgi:hypothetical protein
MKFTGIINRFEENNVFFHLYIPIPENVFNEMIMLSPDKRIICTLNDDYAFHCAMIPKSTFHYILLNAEISKKLKLNVNDEINIELISDKTEYGIDISEEFQEVLSTDKIGKELFKKLTPGKQRSLIYMINKVKNPQTKIDKSFMILEHLKRNKGTLDLKLLNQDIKNFSQQQKL